MKLTVERIGLALRHTFTISRSSRDVEPRIIVALDHEGITGLGEAAPSGRYGETPESVLAFLARVDWPSFTDPFRLDDIMASLDALSPGDASAKAAVDIALHDWIGKKLRMPLWRIWGLNDARTPTTSFTIGIDEPGIIERKVREAEPYPILKVKAGIPGDELIIRTIRRLTDKVIRVDANEGWKSRKQALEKILWLEQQGVEFVEQPMPAGSLQDIEWLRSRVHIPLLADESVRQLSDIPRISAAFDGINIKLMKCAGLREAMRMIHAARATGMKVMLGCMIESSIAISAAAQLSPMVDYADLDGNMLVTNDPYDGVKLSHGKLVLNGRPGLGVVPAAASHGGGGDDDAGLSGEGGERASGG